MSKRTSVSKPGFCANPSRASNSGDLALAGLMLAASIFVVIVTLFI